MGFLLPARLVMKVMKVMKVMEVMEVMKTALVRLTPGPLTPPMRVFPSGFPCHLHHFHHFHHLHHFSS